MIIKIVKSCVFFTFIMIIPIWNIINRQHSNIYASNILENKKILRSRQLSEVSKKSTCDCYALGKNKWNGFPYNLVCEFEDIILYETKLYVDYTQCTIHMLDNLSLWNKQNRLKLKKRTDQSSIEIDKIVIQSVLQEEWMGAIGTKMLIVINFILSLFIYLFF